MTNRVSNWPAKLTAYIHARRSMEFAWGTHDCCQFARGAVAATTGVDPAAAWSLPEYHTCLSALRILKLNGGLAALPLKAGLQEISILRAGRGDIVLAPFGKREALGVCVGPLAAFPGK